MALLRPVYGLSSAPKAWYDRLLEVMEQCGFDSKLTDEGVLRLIGKDGSVAGILALHVDDTIGGGTAEFHSAMDLVCQSLEVGAKEKDTFHYKGLRVTTVWDDDDANKVFYITLDGDEYLDSLILMEIPVGEDCQELSQAEAKDFRSVAGCVGYIANAFRPELAYECSMLGREFFSPTVGSAKIANDTIKWAKDNRYSLMFKKGFCDSLTIFCDSAGPSEEGTQGGRLIALTDVSGNSVSSFLFWESRKVKRVCKATITGETLSAGEGHESGMWIQQMWFELTGKRIPIRIVVDSEGLLKNAGTTKLPLQKRLRIDMSALRQGLRRGEFEMTWVPSKANLSDQMTKSQPRGSRLTKPNDDMKKPLLTALRTNNTGMSRFKHVTKTQADVSNY